jgi:small-conductance mechanosensitive channel
MPPQTDWLRVTVALAVVVALAYGVAQVAVRLARAALTAIVRHEGASLTAVVQPIRVIRGAVFLATVAALSLPALEIAGVRTDVGVSSHALTAWLFGSGLRVLVIAILTYALLRVIAAVARRLEQEMGHVTTADMAERLKRARTLSRLVQHALSTLVTTIATLMVLRELQLDIMPILTGAGIVGLAVGFGAQTLVKDLIAGFFITLENQVRVGDVAVINGTSGLIEQINLRTIVMRDGDGAVHVFPSGSVERLSNLTKDYSYAVVDVGVGFSEDPDRVIQTLHDVGGALASDPRFAPFILEPIEVMGVDRFEESRMVVKARIKTLPLKQWDIARELRRRIATTFDARGIVMPVKQVVVQPESRQPADR